MVVISAAQQTGDGASVIPHYPATVRTIFFWQIKIHLWIFQVDFRIKFQSHTIQLQVCANHVKMKMQLAGLVKVFFQTVYITMCYTRPVVIKLFYNDWRHEIT